MVREKSVSVVQLCYSLCKTCLEDQPNKDECCELALKLLKRCEDGCNDSFVVGNSLWQELDDADSPLLEKILNCLEVNIKER
ncbi:unnamed protein product [Soboliphyme baturini]|uniref:Uncharacterized protein n=1 Tax=Soboliphyme baturini TaxID=241478 RepID=A0A183IUN0_9BILA|nr:unnamed protein product [Soboliphyme baturini]